MINLLYRKKYFNNIPKLKKCKEDAKYIREWILSIIWWILTRGDVNVKVVTILNIEWKSEQDLQKWSGTWFASWLTIIDGVNNLFAFLNLKKKIICLSVSSVLYRTSLIFGYGNLNFWHCQFGIPWNIFLLSCYFRSSESECVGGQSNGNVDII